MDGALIINKPAGMTSHDVVAKARRVLGERSIGHLGTLDPDATGVLPLLLGKLTRLAQFFQGRQKEYCGELRFGFATTTYDAGGAVVGAVVEAAPAPEAIERALAGLRGTILQTPPPYSAKKVDGVRAYKLARADKPVRLEPVAVEVESFEVFDQEGDRLGFRVVCGSGTYIRSLAHDLGQTLGCGAHLTRLERTRVGEFAIAASHTFEALAAHVAAGTLEAAMVPAVGLLPEFPAVIAPAEAAARLLQGRAANLPEFSQAGTVKVFTPDGRMLALATRIAGSLFQPKIVFPPG